MVSIFLDFVNSRYYNTHPPFQDGLSDPEWIWRFVQNYELDIPLADFLQYQDDIINLRELMFCITERIEENGLVSAEDLHRINHFMKKVHLIFEMELTPIGYHTIFIPVEPGIACLYFQVTAAFSGLLAKGNLYRLKLCKNPACQLAFHDNSKNNSRKWCGNTCASLVKVRNYRKRMRHQTK
jgi:predicted RNA-binding Zn ribbon-like protein